MIFKGREIKKVYFVGIKGVGMTALAQFLVAAKVEVCGSDTADVFMTDKVLDAEEIKVYGGFTQKNLHQAGEVDLYVYSTAYNPDNNEELKFLVDNKKDFLLLPYPEVVAEIFNESIGICVAGSHGKTTTSAMLAYVLKGCGLDPKAIVGSEVPQFGGNVLTGEENLFILESDEYQHKLLKYHPRYAILTNIDWDHPDIFPTPQDYRHDFELFMKNISAEGVLVACFEDVQVKEASMQAKCPVLSYGFSKDFNYSAVNIEVLPGRQFFDVFESGRNLGQAEILLGGQHNVLNALSVIALCRYLNISFADIVKSLAGFKGTRRRMQLVGQYQGALLVDDYAHHPTEIKATLEAVKEFYPDKKIICFFQPHTYSRTESLFKEFANSFLGADVVYVLNIYSSARETKGSLNAQDLSEAISQNGVKSQAIGSLEQAEEFIKKKLKKGDLLLTLGAGDVWKINEHLVFKGDKI